MTAAYLSAVYPRYSHFKTLVRAVDPKGKFGNDLTAALLGHPGHDDRVVPSRL
jgi:hypothetical protein